LHEVAQPGVNGVLARGNPRLNARHFWILLGVQVGSVLARALLNLIVGTRGMLLPLRRLVKDLGGTLTQLKQRVVEGLGILTQAVNVGAGLVSVNGERDGYLVGVLVHPHAPLSLRGRSRSPRSPS